MDARSIALSMACSKWEASKLACKACMLIALSMVGSELGAMHLLWFSYTSAVVLMHPHAALKTMTDVSDSQRLHHS